MSKTLTETATFTANVTCPVDGDARNAASVEVGLQALTNRTKYLNAYTLRAALNDSHCTDANQNVDVTQGDVFRVPAAITGTRTYTLINGASLPVGSIKRFWRPSGANAGVVTFVAGGSGLNFAASQPSWAEFMWTGSDWHVIGWAETAVTAIASLSAT